MTGRRRERPLRAPCSAAFARTPGPRPRGRRSTRPCSPISTHRTSSSPPTTWVPPARRCRPSDRTRARGCGRPGPARRRSLRLAEALAMPWCFGGRRRAPHLAGLPPTRARPLRGTPATSPPWRPPRRDRAAGLGPSPGAAAARGAEAAQARAEASARQLARLRPRGRPAPHAGPPTSRPWRQQASAQRVVAPVTAPVAARRLPGGPHVEPGAVPPPGGRERPDRP